jgi:DNA-binding FadR family transcriptional regulator
MIVKEITSPQNKETGNLFATVTREATLSSRVTSQIEKLITEMQLQPGQRMPSERELSERFGVSRTVVREAVRTLTAKGMLEVRPGSGTSVSKPTARAMTSSMTHYLRSGQPKLDFEKLIEVRRLLEVGIAEIAAERRDAEDVQALRAQLAALKNLDDDDREGFVRSDIGFHMALAQAAHNEFFVLLLDSLNEMMIESRRLAFKLPRTRANAYRHHKAILRAIVRQDVAGTSAAMHAHLVEAAETAREALKR